MTKRNVVEWAVLIVSVLAIVAVVGVLVVSGLSESRPPDPAITIRTGEARPGSLGWIVPATVHNEGGEAAEAVVLEAQATVGGETESSELQILYLPAGTSVDLAFAFSDQPQGPVEVRLVGFRVP